MKTKMFLIAFVAIAMVACNEKEIRANKQANQQSLSYESGVNVRKVRVDSIDYIVVTNYGSGVAIIRHSK
jgi:outer membrane lipoprotein SlyB